MSDRNDQHVDLPVDPDWDDVPEQLRDRDDGELIVVDEDGVSQGTLVILPEAFARARMIREDRERS